MRKVLLLAILNLVTISLSAQNLTLAQILEVKNKSLANTETYLTAKGWGFSEAKEAGADNFGVTVYKYKKSDAIDNAESFLYFIHNEQSNITRISVHISKQSKYTEYFNAIKGSCNLISSKVKEGATVEIYRNATTTFKIISNTAGPKVAKWILMIYSNDDFNLSDE